MVKHWVAKMELLKECYLAVDLGLQKVDCSGVLKADYSDFLKAGC